MPEMREVSTVRRDRTDTPAESISGPGPCRTAEPLEYRRTEISGFRTGRDREGSA